MLISFFNPSDLIGCGGDINQSEEGYMEGVCRGVHGGGTRRWYMGGYVEGGASLFLVTISCP